MSQRKRTKVASIGAMLGMYHYETYYNKGDHRVPKESGYEWVTRTLADPTYCFDMFRMSRPFV